VADPCVEELRIVGLVAEVDSDAAEQRLLREPVRDDSGERHRLAREASAAPRKTRRRRGGSDGESGAQGQDLRSRVEGKPVEDLPANPKSYGVDGAQASDRLKKPTEGRAGRVAEGLN